MNWWLLLLWQALLPTSGAVTGRILAVEKMSAVEGTSATLQCNLIHTTAEVTQVIWKRNEQLLAVCDSVYGSLINPVFRRKVNLALDYGITLLSLTVNDTAEYHCDFHTFPDGIYKGNIFLEVTERNLPGDSAEALDNSYSRISFGVMVSVIIIIAATVIMLVILGVKRKTFRISSANYGLQSPSEQNELSPSSHGRCVQLEATPMTISQDYQQENDSAQSHEYFNILSYRSLSSFNLPVETR
ncbi:T-cell immunoreceptor with Ig and ITIM domains isoform X2 [Phascolarctos cinereus]|uniref:T-cell immunoreceptor with Ig and ITIM domains isoform X2 n=1 Tax=Phascolarctos cinereus TaxID=38626 RepID=UPI000A28A444|nr:T-cell immunoreceptor with Ig and ITIM domains isoform X2 [Phascolarctos cinereus]